MSHIETPVPSPYTPPIYPRHSLPRIPPSGRGKNGPLLGAWVQHDKKFLVFREIAHFTIKFYKKFQCEFSIPNTVSLKKYFPNFLPFKNFAL